MSHPEKRDLALLAVSRARAHTRSEIVIIDGRSDPTRWRKDMMRKENYYLVLEGRKRCRSCGEIKPLTEFHQLKEGRGGVRPRCKDCENTGARHRSHKRYYAISYEEYLALYAAQEFCCAICGQLGKSPDTMVRTGKRGQSGVLVVDHDHSTGKIRALLCGSCNRGIGDFRYHMLVSIT